MSDVELNTAGLDTLLKILKKKIPLAKVGALGSPRQTEKGQASALTNAQVGLFAEFGTKTSPVRSWLRMPLFMFLEERIESSGAFGKDAIKEVFDARSFTPWLRKIALIAEGIVLEGFDTGGFGQWPPSDMRYKKVHMTLVETQQLRNSITSEVKEG